MQKLIVANWKMFLTHNESINWIQSNAQMLLNCAKDKNVKLILCPSFTVLAHMNSSGLLWGAQNCSSEEQGSFTGDISPLSLKELGCSFVIVGHSEQRRYHGETDATIAQKVKLLQKIGITPIVCIGESADERPYFKEVIKTQLAKLTQAELIIAYEPVWAIGTGIIPTRKELKESIDFIRSQFDGHTTVTILYGGSVNDESAALYTNIVDGFLVGKASIDAQLLKKIILSC